MEQQIQDLIASIKKDGIEAAKTESDRIIAEAEAKAASILKEAEDKSRSMIADAEKEIGVMRSSSEASIKQAARDVSLSLKKNIEEKYSEILRDAVKKSVTGVDLAELIKAALVGDVSGKAVEISASDMAALRSELSSAFSDEIKKGLDIRPSSALSSGFRITEKDGSGYIDYSDEECAKLLMPYLSDSLKEIIG